MNIYTNNFNHQTIYQIKIQGLLKKEWEAWLNGKIVDISREDENTSITVIVTDQAALRGILNNIWDLNLTIVSVTQFKEKYDE